MSKLVELYENHFVQLNDMVKLSEYERRNKQTQTIVEQIKKTDEHGNEYWSARDKSKALGYSEYRHFKPVVEKAKEAC